MTTEQNKAIVKRVNMEFIEGGNMDTFHELFAADFIDHTAPAGVPTGPDSVLYFFNQLLKPAFPDLKVIIHEQVAEGDKVTTRKSFHATHKAEFFGIPASNKPVVMNVIDIITVRDGKFREHWGIMDMQNVLAQISGN